MAKICHIVVFMMKIIADISTHHSQWMIVAKDGSQRLLRGGFNPFVHDNDDFQSLLPSIPASNTEKIDIHLYGAGFTAEKSESLKAITRRTFKNADIITIESDLLAACRAMANGKEAIIATIGTGANHCHYSGNHIVQSLPALGYILGDEGGGASIGKAVLAKASRKQLSPTVQQAFERTYGSDVGQILTQTYLQDKTALFLSQFAHFAKTYENDPTIKAVLDQNFRSLADNLQSYGRPDLPHYFTGTMAQTFPDHIAVMCATMGIKEYHIINDILDPLTVYHNHSDIKHTPSASHDGTTKKSLSALATEAASQYNNLDQMNVMEIITSINNEDLTVPQNIRKVLPQIEVLISNLVNAMENGGRLFYIGAGTSGRLGVVDASECPPTFGVDHEKIIGLIAGGDQAIRKAVEGAEDDRTLAWKDMARYQPTDKDFVIGIAASGRTPYVIGGLEEAKKHGLKTGCIVCNPNSEIGAMVDYPVEIVTGSEFLTGSTRMKAGTAQKLVLNMVTTATMIRLGHVKDNMMIDMKLSNHKLMDRGIRMVRQMTHTDEKTARKLLEKHGSVRKAVDILKPQNPT